jgi:hypothetical protein
LIALVKIAVVFARRGAMVPPSLSTEERRRLDTLLGKNKKT